MKYDDDDEYINTRAPYSKNEIDALFNLVENYKKFCIDGKVLATLMKLAYFCALKKGELIGLNIKDIRDGSGKIVGEVEIEGKKFKFDSNTKGVLVEHLKHLKDNAYKKTLNSPVFPSKNRKRYCERKLNRHLERIWFNNIKDLKSRIHLREVRQAGICHFYESLKPKGLRPLQCVEETKKFAHCEELNLKNILTGRTSITVHSTLY